MAGLAVLLFHSLNAYPPDALPIGFKALQAVTEWGWLGVHVFFAISGWCIAERLAKGRRTGESGRHFAAERFLRIYPTYWAALLVLVLVLDTLAMVQDLCYIAEFNIPKEVMEA